MEIFKLNKQIRSISIMFNSHPAFVSLEIQAINIFCRLWVSTLKLNGCRVMRTKLRIILKRGGEREGSGPCHWQAWQRDKQGPQGGGRFWRDMVPYNLQGHGHIEDISINNCYAGVSKKEMATNIDKQKKNKHKVLSLDLDILFSHPCRLPPLFTTFSFSEVNNKVFFSL